MARTHDLLCSRQILLPAELPRQLSWLGRITYTNQGKAKHLNLIMTVLSKQATRQLSLLGVQEANFLKNITDAKSFPKTNTTTLGIVIDDPTHPDEISEEITSRREPMRLLQHTTLQEQPSSHLECLQMLSRWQRYSYIDLCTFRWLERQLLMTSCAQVAWCCITQIVIGYLSFGKQ